MTLDRDIYTEPDGSPETLSRLGPLRGLAGIWTNHPGTLDIHPVAISEGGSEADPYLERYEAQPIDYQTNGPQLFYGLRYHTHITRPHEVAMFHDQVGYWLWEPATNSVVFTLAIPRGQVALAHGQCDADATSFTVNATHGSTTYGIASNPFLEQYFKTTAFEMTVTIHDDGSWSYDQTTTLVIPDRTEPFLHTDVSHLYRVTDPTPNPLASTTT